MLHTLANCYTRYQIGVDPLPVGLNRHAVIHTIDHPYDDGDAVIACLYAATLLAARLPNPARTTDFAAA